MTSLSLSISSPLSKTNQNTILSTTPPPPPPPSSSSSLTDRHGYLNILEESFTNVLFDRRKDNSIQLKGCSFNVLMRSLFVISLASSSLQSNGSYVLSFQLLNNTSNNKYKDLVDELPGRREGGCWVPMFDPICTLLPSIASIEEISNRIMTLLRLLLQDDRKTVKGYGGRDSNSNSDSDSDRDREYICHYIEGGLAFIYFWMEKFHIHNTETTILKVRQHVHTLMTFCNRHLTTTTPMTTATPTTTDETISEGYQQIKTRCLTRCTALSTFVDKLAVFYSKLTKGIRIKGLPLKESSVLTYPHTVQTIGTGIGGGGGNGTAKIVSTNYKKQNIERLSQLSEGSSSITIFGGMSILNASDDDDDDDDDNDDAYGSNRGTTVYPGTSNSNSSDAAPTPPLPLLQSGFSLNQDPSSLTVWDFHVQELARQWTLVDHQLFCSIPLSSFLSSSSKVPLWTLPRDQANKRAPVIRKCIDSFNSMTLWVTASVLSGSTPASRAVTYGLMVDLAAYFKLLKNYHGLMAVVTGLNQAAVTRLTETVRLVSAKRTDTLKRLERLMSGSKNYGNYRMKLDNDLLDLRMSNTNTNSSTNTDSNSNSNSNTFRDTVVSSTSGKGGGPREAPQSALVPHLGAHLAEIASVLEGGGGGEYLARDSHHHFLNLDRYKLLSSSLARLAEIRAHRYTLHPVPLMQTVISRTLHQYTKLSSADFEREARAFYDLSLTLEEEAKEVKVPVAVAVTTKSKESVISVNDDDDDDDIDNDDDLFDDEDDDDEKKKKSFTKSVKRTYTKLLSLSGLKKRDNTNTN